MRRPTIHTTLPAAWHQSCSLGRAVWVLLLLLLTTAGCEREPQLHLYDSGDVEIQLPVIDLDLEAYWDYSITYGLVYDWQAEWYYGWDQEDERLFGPIGYVEPTVFNLRRYYTGGITPAHHTQVLSNTVNGKTFRGKYNWGFWDILAWNDIEAVGGVQSLNFDETSSLDSVVAYTNMSMHASRYHAPRFTRSFYEPEALFSAYEEGVEINRNLEDFEYDAERNVYVKKLNMTLHPITYIYLTQIILHHNNKIISIDGTSNLSGMARSVNVNTGLAGNDAISVYYNMNMKKNCDMDGETVDIIGGRLLTFGICNLNPNLVTRPEQVKDVNRHYIDVNMKFRNSMDSTFVFDVTDQVRKRFKGGVITVELDMDTVKMPDTRNGSAFDAVVKDYEDGGTHEFEM
ncbi:MAG: hypothetical protein IJ546_01960 [Prevotella sp.]|nr:hypothetical protein [Prevotella sp.]